jgi:hypothetical protein
VGDNDSIFSSSLARYAYQRINAWDPMEGVWATNPFRKALPISKFRKGDAAHHIHTTYIHKSYPIYPTSTIVFTIYPYHDLQLPKNVTFLLGTCLPVKRFQLGHHSACL